MAIDLYDGVLTFRAGSQDSKHIAGFSEDEAQILENVRVLANGAAEVRGGSRKLHASSLGSGGYGGVYFEPTFQDGVLVQAGLAISGEDAKAFKTTAEATFRIDGEEYEKAATDELAFSAADTITGEKFGIWLVQIDDEGTITTKPADTSMAYDTDDEAIDDLPDPDDGNVALGYILVEAGAGGFTANTDALTDISTFVDAKTVAMGDPQLLAFVGAKAFASEDSGATWTEIASGLREDYWTFATIRIGDTVHLICANGGTVYKWDGALTDGWSELDNAPSGVTVVKTFNDRLYALGHDGNFIAASAIRNPERWDTPWGLVLPIGVHDARPVTSMEVGGPVLLVSKRGSIAWVDGFGNSDIIVGQGARGISQSVGIVAHRSLIAAGDAAVLGLSERGVEIYTGDGVQSASTARRMFFRDEVNWAAIEENPGRVSAVWNAAENEYLIALPTGDEDANRAILSINLTTGAIVELYRNRGDTASADPAILFTGGRSEIYAVGDDGFVRRFDIGKRDNENSDGTGGTPFTARIRTRAFAYRSLFNRKRARIVDVVASHPTGASLRIRAVADDKPGPWANLRIPASTYDQPEQARALIHADGLLVALDIETEDAGLRIHGIRLGAETLRQVA